MANVEMKDLENVKEMEFMGQQFNMYGTIKNPIIPFARCSRRNCFQR